MKSEVKGTATSKRLGNTGLNAWASVRARTTTRTVSSAGGNEPPSHPFLQQPFTSVEALLRPEPGGNELATVSVRIVSLRPVWDQSAVSVGSVSSQSGVRLRSQTSPCRITPRVNFMTLRETHPSGGEGGIKAQRSCSTSAVRHTWLLYSELGKRA